MFERNEGNLNGLVLDIVIGFVTFMAIAIAIPYLATHLMWR